MCSLVLELHILVVHHPAPLEKYQTIYPIRKKLHLSFCRYKLDWLHDELGAEMELQICIQEYLIFQYVVYDTKTVQKDVEVTVQWLHCEEYPQLLLLLKKVLHILKS